MTPCKHLDYSTAYEDCEIKTCAPQLPHVRYWERGERWTDGGRNPSKVQFCGQGRGRINGIFQCYNAGEMTCYEPEDKPTAASPTVAWYISSFKCVFKNCVVLPDVENTDANAKALREQVGRMNEDGQRYWVEKESWAFQP